MSATIHITVDSKMVFIDTTELPNDLYTEAVIRGIQQMANTKKYRDAILACRSMSLAEARVVVKQNIKSRGERVRDFTRAQINKAAKELCASP